MLAPRNVSQRRTPRRKFLTVCPVGLGKFREPATGSESLKFLTLGLGRRSKYSKWDALDDVINVAGHRLSTGQMEEVVATHSDVAECAVIGVHDSLKGQFPLGLVVLKSGVNRGSDDIRNELRQMIRNTIGPIACYVETCVVKRLPKTAGYAQVK